MTYIYITKRNNPLTNKRETIAGALQARHSFEALHNARIEAQLRGADIRSLLLTKIA